jgi:hypothetical protein
MIPFVPSKRQLRQTVSQVFEIKNNYLNTGYMGIFTIAEEQLSFIISPPSQIDINNSTFAA